MASRVLTDEEKYNICVNNFNGCSIAMLAKTYQVSRDTIVLAIHDVKNSICLAYQQGTPTYLLAQNYNTVEAKIVKVLVDYGYMRD